MKKIIPVFILLFSGVLSAQESGKAVLVNKIGVANCEYLIAITEGFLQELANSPTSKALIVTNAKKAHLRGVSSRHKQILARFQFSSLDDRVSFVVTENNENNNEIETSFWTIPPGAPEPIIDGSTWAEPKPDLSKPFIFGYENENGICPKFVPRLYAELLFQNPRSHGHIVISGETTQERIAFAKYWLESFKTDYKLQRNRFRIYYVKKKELASAEFWYIPSKAI